MLLPRVQASSIATPPTHPTCTATPTSQPAPRVPPLHSMATCQAVISRSCLQTNRLRNAAMPLYLPDQSSALSTHSCVRAHQAIAAPAPPILTWTNVTHPESSEMPLLQNKCATSHKPMLSPLSTKAGSKMLSPT